MRSLILRFSIFIGIALVLYLSWLPQPKLGLIWFIPNWLADWTDTSTNDNLRTAVPFVILGIIVSCYNIHKDYSLSRLLVGWLSLTVVVIIAEIGQLLLPYRSFDWKDIIWGAVGSLISIGIIFLCKQLKM